MKKKIIAMVLVSGLAVSTVASANWGRGGGAGVCANYMQGQSYQQLDPTIQEKIDTFLADTQSTRKQIVMKQAEKMALLQAANPDPAALSKVAGELFDLRATMKTKAIEAGVDQYVGPMGFGGNGRGHHRGGRMMQNYQQ